MKVKLYGFLFAAVTFNAVTALGQPITDTAIIEQGQVRGEVTGTESASWFMSGRNIEYRGAAFRFDLGSGVGPPSQNRFFVPGDAVNLSGHALEGGERREAASAFQPVPSLLIEVALQIRYPSP